MAELTKGANIALESTSLRVAFAWTPVAEGATVDICAILVAADGHSATDHDLVFYNNPTHPSDAVRLTGAAHGDGFEIDLTQVPGEIDRIVVGAATWEGTFASTTNLKLAVEDRASSFVIATFPVTASVENALVLVEVYRRGDAWKLRAVGQGYEGGLHQLASEHGIDVGPPPEPASAAGTAGGASALQIVPGRQQERQVAGLRMRCGSDGTPQPIGAVEPIGYWSGTAELIGIPEWTGHQASSGALQVVWITVTPHRALAIFSRAGTDAEIWFSLPIGSFTAQGIGAQGSSRKRPEYVELTGPDWTVRVRTVTRYVAAVNRYQDLQEQSLLAALNTTPTSPEPQA